MPPAAGDPVRHDGQDQTSSIGRYYEDFALGDRYDHPVGRTISEADNTWFSLLTQNMARIHFDAEFARQTGFGRPLVNSTLTLAIVTGQSVIDVSFNVKANLGWDNVRLPAPLFAGDTLYSSSEVTGLRLSRSHGDAGLVTVHTRGFNQREVTVIAFDRTLLVYRRGCGPRPFQAPTEAL